MNLNDWRVDQFVRNACRGNVPPELERRLARIDSMVIQHSHYDGEEPGLRSTQIAAMVIEQFERDLREGRAVTP